MSYQSKYTGQGLEYILDNAMLRNELNLSEYAKKTDIPAVPDKLSQLENDEGFVDEGTVDTKIESAIRDITGVDLSKYVTYDDLDNAIEDAIADIGNIDVNYKSSIEDKTLAMPNDVGGLDKGTKVSDLEGKSYSELFDDLLFPTVYPTFVAPSATIKFNNYSSIQEVGVPAPGQSSFTTSFNRGAINLNGVKQNDRAGILTSGSVYCVSGNMPSTVTLGGTQYKYRANYAQGPQPKDNKGNNYDSPLASGYVDSAAITLNGTHPWYIGTTKQPLVAWSTNMSTGNFTLQATGVAPQIFKLPKALKELQMLNTISGKMEVIGTSDWSTTNESINGISYYVYTYTGSARGEVTLLAKF